MKKILSILFLILTLQCSETENECIDCGGEPIDGYLYKEVTIEDISSLANINVPTEIGNCIRFKRIETEFLDAKVVDECCCIQY